MNPLRRLTYRPEVLALARALHLTDLLRTAYYWSKVRDTSSATLSLDGLQARFVVRSPFELRHLEYNLVLEESSFLGYLKAALQPGDCFYDVGSNLGIFAAFIAKVVGSRGQVVAFEPHPMICEKLRENIAENRLQNVRIFQKALGEANSTQELYVEGQVCPSLINIGGLTADSSVKSPLDGSDHSPINMVEVVSGDWIRENQNLPIPKAVKIDVEGFEYSVLSGLRRTLCHVDCRILCCEIHPEFLPPGATLEKIVQLVKSFGFVNLRMTNRLSQFHLIASKT